MNSTFNRHFCNMDSVRWAFNFRKWVPLKEEWMLCLSLIQQEEKERISKFVYKKDAKGSLAGRLLMRKVVMEKYNIPWSGFKLQRTEKGRPFYQSSSNEIKFDFNVSHQGKWVVLAAEGNGAKVGIDIMEIQTPSTKNVSEFFRLMRKQFTPVEWKIICESSCEKVQLKSFYRNWCLKEAFVKALGVGISYDLQSISFTPFRELTTGMVIKKTQVAVNGDVDPTWIFEECLLDETHIVTVAIQQSEEYYKEKDFKILSFEELILNSEQITQPDMTLAEKFIHKNEQP